jgi:phage-related tail fiber protein
MNYFMKLTQYGAAKVASAQADGPPVELTHMAVGDGNGQPVTAPTGIESQLVREVHRRPIAAMYKNPNDATIFMVEMTIPSEVGGWPVREVGIFDTDGGLFAYGNFPETYKPTGSEGATRDMVVVAAVKVADSATVTLIIDTSVVLASRAWVISTITAAFLIPGGLTNQILAKASNSPGDFKWIDITEGVQVLVGIVQETQILATDQTVVNFSTVTTSGLAVYVDGKRLVQGDEYSITDLAQVTLAISYPAGTVLHAYQNDPLEAPEYLRPGLNLSDIPDKRAARNNIGAPGRTTLYFMGQS